MLRLLLKITVAWVSLSLFCSVLWVLLIQLAMRRNARQASTVTDASARTLSEKDVEALLTAPAARYPIGRHNDTKQRIGEPKLTEVSS